MTPEPVSTVSDIVTRIKARPGPRGGLTGPYIEELAQALAAHIDQKFPGMFSRGDRVKMGRTVCIQQQAQRHSAGSAVDVRAQDNPLDQALLSAACDLALDSLGQDPPLIRDWAARDAILVAQHFHEAGREGVIAALRELKRRGQYVESQIVQCYLILAEEFGREPALWETATEVGVDRETVASTLLMFKNLLSQS